MVIRTWLCRQCQHEFDADIDNPCCIKCGHGPAQWIPKGGHPLKQLRHQDRMMRVLADDYGLTNMRTAREGESVMPRDPAPKLTGNYSPLPGVEVPVASDSATCAPFKVNKNMFDGAAGPITPPPKMPSLREKTNIVARWDKSKGETRP